MSFAPAGNEVATGSPPRDTVLGYRQLSGALSPGASRETGRRPWAARCLAIKCALRCAAGGFADDAPPVGLALVDDRPDHHRHRLQLSDPGDSGLCRADTHG